MLLDLTTVPVLETARLRLRLPTPADADRFALMYGDPKGMPVNLYAMENPTRP